MKKTNLFAGIIMLALFMGAYSLVRSQVSTFPASSSGGGGAKKCGDLSDAGTGCSSAAGVPGVSALHFWGTRNNITVGPVSYSGYTANNPVVLFVDWASATASNATCVDSNAGTLNLVSASINGRNNATNAAAYYGTLGAFSGSVTCTFPSGSSFSGVAFVELSGNVITTVDGTPIALADQNYGGAGDVPIKAGFINTTATNSVLFSMCAFDQSTAFGLGPMLSANIGRTAGNDVSQMWMSLLGAPSNFPVGITYANDALNACIYFALKP